MKQIKQVIAIALMITATQAQAWGAREQGILTGVFATILLQQVHNNNQERRAQQHPPVTVGEQPVYSQPQVIVQQPQIIVQRPRYTQQPRMYIPAPARCEVVPVYDHWGRYIAQQTVCNW